MSAAESSCGSGRRVRPIKGSVPFRFTAYTGHYPTLCFGIGRLRKRGLLTDAEFEAGKEGSRPKRVEVTRS